MNMFLWILAFALAAVFVASGAMKLLAPREQQIEKTPYAEDFPHSVIHGIGALEILGALGLVVPALTGIATVLVPLAAGGDPAGLRPVAGSMAWLALAWLLLEVLAVLLSLYLFSLPTDLSTPDLLAFAGYKYVG